MGRQLVRKLYKPRPHNTKKKTTKLKHKKMYKYINKHINNPNS